MNDIIEALEKLINFNEAMLEKSPSFEVGLIIGEAEKALERLKGMKVYSGYTHDKYELVRSIGIGEQRYGVNDIYLNPSPNYSKPITIAVIEDKE